VHGHLDAVIQLHRDVDSKTSSPCPCLSRWTLIVKGVARSGGFLRVTCSIHVFCCHLASEEN